MRRNYIFRQVLDQNILANIFNFSPHFFGPKSSKKYFIRQSGYGEKTLLCKSREFRIIAIIIIRKYESNVQPYIGKILNRYHSFVSAKRPSKSNRFGKMGELKNK